MPFTPPFCPNPHCPTHKSPHNLPLLWFKRTGSRPTLCVGPVPRFKCLVCDIGFSSRTFDIDYWVHKPVDYKLIQNLQVSGAGLRQSGRTLGVSTRLLANRHIRLSHNALALQARCLEDLEIKDSSVLPEQHPFIGNF